MPLIKKYNGEQWAQAVASNVEITRQETMNRQNSKKWAEKIGWIQKSCKKPFNGHHVRKSSTHVCNVVEVKKRPFLFWNGSNRSNMNNKNIPHIYAGVNK